MELVTPGSYFEDFFLCSRINAFPVRNCSAHLQVNEGGNSLRRRVSFCQMLRAGLALDRSFHSLTHTLAFAFHTCCTLKSLQSGPRLYFEQFKRSAKLAHAARVLSVYQCILFQTVITEVIVPTWQSYAFLQRTEGLCGTLGLYFGCDPVLSLAACQRNVL